MLPLGSALYLIGEGDPGRGTAYRRPVVKYSHNYLRHAVLRCECDVFVRPSEYTKILFRFHTLLESLCALASCQKEAVETFYNPVKKLGLILNNESTVTSALVCESLHFVRTVYIYIYIYI